MVRETLLGTYGKLRLMKLRLPLLLRQTALAVLLGLAFATSSLADIFAWELIDPTNPALGRQQSTTLVPEGAGRDAVPDADLNRLDLTMAWLAEQDLRRIEFRGANISDADFTASNIGGARFGPFRSPDLGTNLTEQQLYSTASYADSNLARVWFYDVIMQGWDLTNQSLVGVNFFSSDVAGASFEGAIVRHADFQRANLAAEQLYSTASYAQRDLRGVRFINNDLEGWDFSNQDLRGAVFVRVNIDGADFTGSDVRGVFFHQPEMSRPTGFTEAMMYSTASYQQGDLRGIGLGTLDLTEWNLAGQNIAGADFIGYDDGPDTLIARTDFRGANLTNSKFEYVTFIDPLFGGADLRGAEFGFSLTGLNLPPDAIGASGTVAEIVVGAGESRTLWDYDGPSDIPITVTTLLEFDPQSELTVLIDDDQWGSLIILGERASASLAGRLRLEVAPDESTNLTDLIGQSFALFDWSGSPPTGQFDAIVVQPGMQWDTSGLHTTGIVTLLAVPEPATWLLLWIPAALASRRILRELGGE